MNRIYNSHRIGSVSRLFSRSPSLIFHYFAPISLLRLPLGSFNITLPKSRFKYAQRTNLVIARSKIMAAKILANLIVMGSGIMIRAVAQAYRQALANASKNGVAHEAVQNTIRRASKTMTEQEARQILGITENSSWEEILKKYDVLFENNAKQGSFYLQSKVHRAKECLEAVYNPVKGEGTGSGGAG